MKNYIVALLIVSITFTSCLEENPNSEGIQVQTELEFPLRDVKTLGFYINQIKADSSWMDMIEEKAKKASISVDEMLKIDAEFIFNQEIEIIKVENDIIKNKEWFEIVKQKAIEQNVSLDEMIRADANFFILRKNQGN